MTSNLSSFALIPERSEATPGLWNNPFSVLSANIAAVSNDLSLGSFPLLNLAVDSHFSDYITLTDTSALRSSYIIGSHIGGTADGLNLYDASGATMIVNFSKQSIRFFQPIIGPVFDTGGDYYNAASFVGSGSSLSGIQAAINQASIDGKGRVLVPASMYPFDASRISFIYPVQMVREGGRWDVYDVQAYGADPLGTSASSISNTSACQGAINSATGVGVAFVSAGTYSIYTSLLIPSNTEFAGEGWQSVIYSAWTQPVGKTTFQNKGYPSSRNTTIRMRSFQLLGGGTGIRTDFVLTRPAGLFFNKVDDLVITDVKVKKCPSISIAYQACNQVRIINNRIEDSEVDGITGYFNCSDVIVANNTIHGTGDDGIAINSDDGVTFGVPTNIAIIGNTIFGQSILTFTQGGRGINVSGVANGLISSNAIQAAGEEGIRVACSDNSVSVRGGKILIIGNTVHSTGSSGGTLFGLDGVSLQSCDDIQMVGNIVSNSKNRGLLAMGIKRLTLTGNSFLSNGTMIAFSAMAVDVSNSYNSFVEVTNNTILGNACGGLGIRTSAAGIVADNIIVDNGLAGDGTSNLAAGIYLDSGAGAAAHNLLVHGNYITDTKAAGSKLQSYGIRVVGASASSYHIVGNYVSNNSGLGISVSGTAPQSLLQYDNSGTQSSGTLLLASSGQSVIRLGGDFTTSVQTTGVILGLKSGVGSEPIEWIGASASNGFGWRAQVFDLGASQVDLVFSRRVNATSFQTAITFKGVNAQLALANGTALAPSSVFTSDISLGFYRSAASTMALSFGTIDLTAAVSSLASMTIKSGANNSCGTAVLGSNGSVNVANTYVKTGDLIFLTDQTAGGTLGDIELGGIRNSSGFTILSTSITDTSTVAWLIIRPG